MIYKVKLKDFLKIADIALTRQQVCCNMVITKKLYHRTHRVRLRNVGITDKKSSHKTRHRKIPGEHKYIHAENLHYNLSTSFSK